MSEQLKLFANDLFSCPCEGHKVQCFQQVKTKAPPVAQTTGEADQPNVVAHVEAESTPIVPQPRSRRQGIMEAREVRGLEIAANSNITRNGQVWVVPSQTSSKSYLVNLYSNPPGCTCPDHESNGLRCKHIYAVEHFIRGQSGEVLPIHEKCVKPTYQQAWAAYNLAQTYEKARFQELLYGLCQSIEDIPRKVGGGRNRLPLGEMIFCSAFKVYSMISGRRFISDLREAQQHGYLLKTPHFNSIFNYFELEEMTACLKHLIIESSLPLKAVETDFAVDSSGFRTRGYSTWFSTKYQREIDKSEWIKVHLMCGVKTNVVTAVEVSGRKDHDSPFFPGLINTTSQSGFTLREVSADKGYDSYNHRRLVLLKGAIPYIPFRSFAQPDGKGELWRRMYHFYCFHQEEFFQHYHKRSNVESTFSMIKAKFGEKLRSKTDVSQVNEALCKVLCHNLCCVIQSIYELGIEVDFCAESSLAHLLGRLT
jgi:transposase